MCRGREGRLWPFPPPFSRSRDQSIPWRHSILFLSSQPHFLFAKEVSSAHLKKLILAALKTLTGFSFFNSCYFFPLLLLFSRAQLPPPHPLCCIVGWRRPWAPAETKRSPFKLIFLFFFFFRSIIPTGIFCGGGGAWKSGNDERICSTTEKSGTAGNQREGGEKHFI